MSDFLFIFIIIWLGFGFRRSFYLFKYDLEQAGAEQVRLTEYLRSANDEPAFVSDNDVLVSNVVLHLFIIVRGPLR